MERTASHCSSSSSLLIAGTAQQVARPGSAPSSRQAAGRRRSRRKAGAGAGMEAGHRGRGNGAAPSSFARISLISAMREASVSAANATATGRNDAAAAVPMAARRPSGRAGVCSAEAPANSVTARVVSMKRFGRQQAREEACTKGALKVELSRGGLIFVFFAIVVSFENHNAPEVCRHGTHTQMGRPTYDGRRPAYVVAHGIRCRP
jgi:hypothetical protein